jgi:cyclopropane-fatty-acyl-phospholipid synthase
MNDSATSSANMPLPAVARAFLHVLGRIRQGYLIVLTPEKERKTFGNSKQTPQAVLSINDWVVCGRILAINNIGFAQAYAEGLIDSPDLLALFRLALLNEFEWRPLLKGSSLANFFRILGRHISKNTRRKSIKNMRAHYENKTDLFRLCFDPGLNYSSGWFNGDYSQSLERAQYAKYQHIIESLGLKPGMRVLDVGCGYGGFLFYAARQGILVDGITISRQEYTFVNEKIEGVALTETARIFLNDYRDRLVSKGLYYDAIISLEMFQAVGESLWDVYFKALFAALKINGKVFIHTAVINEDYYLGYRAHNDFIRQFIFPGMMLASPARVSFSAEKAGLKTIHMTGLARDYLETFRLWRINFEINADAIKKLGMDESAMKMWRLYLSYAEVAFETERANGLEIILEKTN